MSTTLSNGYKLPTAGDRGSSWFSDLEDNIVRVNSHDHDGINSEKLASSNIERQTSSLVAGNWTLVADGTYKQTVSMPSGYTMTESTFKFQINSGADLGDIFYPVIDRLTDTSYDIFINDNTVDVLVTYV